MATVITQTNKLGRFIKGSTPWNKGVKLTVIFWEGKKHSEESKKKMSESAKGRVPWNKGIRGVYKTSVETKQKISESLCGEKSYQWKGGKPKCLSCNVSLKSIYAKRCRKCAGILFRKENNHNWKGGTQKKDRLERVRFQRTVQKIVLERDNYTCQVCNKRGGSLQVDHIQKWSVYPDLRFKIENCRTLCMSCHYKITFNREMPDGTVWGHNLSHIKERMVD